MIAPILIHTCTIQLRVASTNAYGEPEYSWVDEQENVPCRFSKPSGPSYTGIPGEITITDLILFLAPTATATEFSRQIVTSESGFSGTYRILMVRAMYNGSSLHHYECDLKKAGSVTEALMRDGVEADVEDGDTITHGYSSAPTKVLITGTVPTEMVSVTSIGATTFTVAIRTNLGDPGTPQTIYWMAIP